MAQNGKQQTRHIGISPNNRSICISTNRPHGGVFGLLSKKGGSANAVCANSDMNEIDFSLVIRIQLGQQSRRFARARSKASKQSSSGRRSPFQSEDVCDRADDATNSISIIYRPPSNSTQSIKDSFVNSVMASSHSVGYHSKEVVMNDGADSLDLIVPEKEDFESLFKTLQDLLALFQQEEFSSDMDLALIQYHLVDMGKSLTPIGTESCVVSCVEWIDLCKRLNVPIAKKEAIALFRERIESHGSCEASEDELLLSEIVSLVDKLRKIGLIRSSADIMAAKGLARNDDIIMVDPLKRLFGRISKIKQDVLLTRISTPSDLVSASSNPPPISDNDVVDVISASAFLEFLKRKQDENDVTLEGVKKLFAQLNSHCAPRQLGDATVVSGNSLAEGIAWEREYISWETFERYLLSDDNDVFDPERSCPSHSYMSEPLSNYFINTSHDTYIRARSAVDSESKKPIRSDLQSYTLALYRGARAIELDVWDCPLGSGEPKIRYDVTSFTEDEENNTNSFRADSGLTFADVILTVRYFLQSEPNSYPIILLIENHCSLRYQEKMASDIQDILVNRGLLYHSFNDSPFPSPEQLIGKVIIKSKRAESLHDTSVVLNDDFDDELRNLEPMEPDYDSDDDLKENVIGFNSWGSIKSPDTTQKYSSEQLYQIAKREALEANAAVQIAQNNLNDSKSTAKQMRNHADALLRDIGMTFEELKEKRENELLRSANDFSDEGTEVELLDDKIQVKEETSRAVKLARLFSESVEESRLLYNAAKAEARSEAELFDMAREDLTDKEIILAEAKEVLQKVSKRKRDLKDAAERALAEARSNREYAINAENRVAAVKALLDKSQSQAMSSETVAGTADAEAQISEQRARDAEARAAKARSVAEEERKLAEKETKLEDNLDAQLVTAHKKLLEAKSSVAAARERADEAVMRTEKLNDEIREAKSSLSHQHNEDVEEKCEERKFYIDQMENALTEKLSREAKTRRLENIIEDLKRKAKVQAKVAAAARKQADQSMSIADQLEEHALEEREAANLRQAARTKANLVVVSSDAVLTSTETQLAEAERAASEASDLAAECRVKADQLAREVDAIEDPRTYEENVNVAQKNRDIAFSVYESALESKEEADQRAAKAKQVHETNCLKMSNLERDAMAELLQRESAHQAEVMTMGACENARAMSERVAINEDECHEAMKFAAEKERALKFALRYREKKRRVQPISPSMANITLIHSAKLRSWGKSKALPSSTLHSVPENMIVERAERGMEEWKSWVDFNRNHFTRTYPSSNARNYNPVLPWAMGCQFVSLNFSSQDDFILLNDGRFRANGNQGYVLKPEYLCDNGLVEDVFNCNHPRKINIRVLSGRCLPKPPANIYSKSGPQRLSVNPIVRITLYDGSPATLLKPPTFSTHVIRDNGLNPVWNEEDLATFECLNPSVGILLFKVYDHCEVTKTDVLIGASAIPVTCMREGFRCVSLYDSNNTRGGAMRFASLFVHVQMV